MSLVPGTRELLAGVDADAERYAAMSRAECKRLGIVRVFIYVRISRDDAEVKGLGVDRQEVDCRAAIDRFSMGVERWVVMGVLDENNTSASDGSERPKLAYGLNRIHNHKADAILVSAPDRLTRMPVELEAILTENDRTPVRLATANLGEFDLTDPDVVYNLRQTTNANAREIGVMRKRRKREIMQFAERGQRHAIAPFGWSRVHTFAPNGRLTGSYDVINEAEAGALRLAVKRILGGVSLRAVTRELAAGDVHPRVREYKKTGPSSGEWSSTQLRRYLLREANVGLRVHHGKVLEGVKGDWPPLWDMATHQRLVAMLTDPERQKFTRGSKAKYLLSGFATCGNCGKRISAQSDNRGAMRYVCVGTTADPGCFTAHRLADIDAHVDRVVEAMLADPSASAPSDDAAEQLAPLYVRLDELAAEQHEWDTAKGIKPAQLAARTAILDAERDEVQQAISALLPSLNVTLDLPNGWAGETNIETKRAVIRNLFASITLNVPVERGKGRKFHPEDVTIVTRREAAARE